MQLRSLGYRTDLIFARARGEVLERQGYLVVRDRSNPTFYWGNFLLFEEPPGDGDLLRWKELFDISKLVIVPDVGSAAGRLYRSLGFRLEEHHYALQWPGVGEG